MPSVGTTVSRVPQVALGPDIPERNEILGRLGENVRRCRAMSCLTQKELADRCFLRQDRLSHLECGKLTPSVLVLLTVSYSLGTAPAALLGGLGAPTREASRAQLPELIEGYPGVKTEDLAGMLGLPFPYVSQIARSMHALGEARWSKRGWQPGTALPSRSIDR
jgi:DNA-binding XRE family transcriptional regulator